MTTHYFSRIVFMVVFFFNIFLYQKVFASDCTSRESSRTSSLDLNSRLDPSQLIYRKADKNDVKQMVSLIDTFMHDPEDNAQASLVVYPERVRERKLRESIDKYFVATTESGKIVAYCKLYCLETKEEVSNILKDELCIVQSIDDDPQQTSDDMFYYPAQPVYQPAFYSKYNPTKTAAIDRKSKWVNEICNNDADFNYDRFNAEFNDNVKIGCDVIIYYGSALTIKEHRGCGINIFLEAYALEFLTHSIQDKIKNFNINIVLLYGVIADRFNDYKSRLKSFATFMTKVFYFEDSDILPISMIACNAFKPEYEMDYEKDDARLSPRPTMLGALSPRPDQYDQHTKTSDSIETPAPSDFISGYGCAIIFNNREYCLIKNIDQKIDCLKFP